MKYITLIVIMIMVTSCSGGGSGGGTLIGTPGSHSGDVQGTYCFAYTTVGVPEYILRDAVGFLDSMAPSIQSFVGNCAIVCIIFDGTLKGFYDGSIHVSGDSEPLHMRLVHEYVHHIHFTYRTDPEWLRETVAEGTEVYFGFEKMPETCDYDIYTINYTTQRHFGGWMISNYGPDIMWKIVHGEISSQEMERMILEWKGE